MEAIKGNEIPMPQDMEGGKDKIVFGNIQQIYEWHKSTFSQELESCLSEASGYIGQLFVKYVNFNLKKKNKIFLIKKFIFFNLRKIDFKCMWNIVRTSPSQNI